MADTSPTSNRFAGLLLVALFLTAISLPALGIRFHITPSIELKENRKLAPFPIWNGKLSGLDKFPAGFEAWFNDRFGFRNLLVRWNNLLKVCLLGDSPTPDVTIGTDGWLFYTKDGVTDYHRGRARLTQDTIESWRRYFESKQNFFASRSIRYLIVVAPNKQSIYPEYFPDSLSGIRSEAPIDQLLKELRGTGNLEILDLRQPILSQKSEGQLYFKTDSHWTPLGASHACDLIFKQLRQWFPSFRPIAAGDYQRNMEPGRGGDLARMLGLPDKFPEETLRLSPPSGREFHDVTVTLDGGMKYPDEAPSVKQNPNGQLRAVLTCDSFGRNMVQFLASNFQRTTIFVRKFPYDAAFERLLPRIVETERPDVFIEELVERNFANTPPLNAIMDAHGGG